MTNETVRLYRALTMADVELGELVVLADGKVGELIRARQEVAGVQVSGESDIRWIAWSELGHYDGSDAIRQSGASHELPDTERLVWLAITGESL